MAWGSERESRNKVWEDVKDRGCSLETAHSRDPKRPLHGRDFTSDLAGTLRELVFPSSDSVRQAHDVFVSLSLFQVPSDHFPPFSVSDSLTRYICIYR